MTKSRAAGAARLLRALPLPLRPPRETFALSFRAESAEERERAEGGLW
jgi:hypothetical protein